MGVTLNDAVDSIGITLLGSDDRAENRKTYGPEIRSTYGKKESKNAVSCMNDARAHHC